MPILAMSAGTVVAIRGTAFIRLPDGTLQPLHIGDKVKGGQHIVTDDNSWVQITPDADAKPLVAAPVEPVNPVDQAIAALETDEEAPAAGLTGGGNGGLLPGLRVDRVQEGVTPLNYQYDTARDPSGFPVGSTADQRALAQGVDVPVPPGQTLPPLVDLDGDDSTTSGTGFQTTATGNGGPVAIADTDALITDSDSVQMSGATVVLTNPQSGDVLTAPGALPGGITAIPSPDGYTITLTGNASLADYQAALAAITYESTVDSPDTTPRQIEVTVTDDSGLSSNTAVSTINVDGPPPPPPASPLLDLDANDSAATGTSFQATATGNGGPVSIVDGDVSITDGDSTQMSGAVVVLTNPQLGDELAFNQLVDQIPAGITATLSPDGLTITLTGNASVADYQNALKAISFESTLDAPSTTPRQIQVTVTDDTGLGSNTAISTINLAITPPVLTIVSTGVVEGDNIPFVLALNHAAAEPITVKLSLANGSDLPGTPVNDSATVGVDTASALEYESAPGAWTSVPASGELTFAPGQTQINVRLATVDDGLVEPTEYVRLVADVVAGATQNAQAANEPEIRDNDHAPVATNDQASTGVGQPVVLDVLSNDTDADGDDLTVTQVNGQPIAAGTPVEVKDPVTGDVIATVSLTPEGKLQVQPAPGYEGPVNFSYTVDDGFGNTDEAVVTVDVVGQSPSAVDDRATTPEDTPVVVDVLSNDSDPEGKPLQLTQINGQDVAPGDVIDVRDPTGQSVIAQVTVLPDGKLEVKPVADYTGEVKFDYTVTDGRTPVHASVVVDVTPVNDPPVAVDDVTNTPKDTPVVVDALGNDSDPDGDDLTITQINGQDVQPGTPVEIKDPVTGNVIATVVITPEGNLQVTPTTGYEGPVNFTYTTEDGEGGSDEGAVTVNVGVDNVAPQAQPDTNQTDEDTVLRVDAANGVIQSAGDAAGQDSDPNGDTLVVSAVSHEGTAGTVGTPLAGQYGSLVLNADGSYTYTPNEAAQALDQGEEVKDTFSYTVRDGQGQTSTTTLQITVVGLNDGPVATADVGVTPKGQPLTLDVLANDSDPDGDDLTITQINGQNVQPGDTVEIKDPVTGEVIAKVSLTPEGKLEVTPEPGFEGPVNFNYTIEDPQGESAQADVKVIVDGNDLNDEPTARPDLVHGTEDQPVSFDPRANDTDPEGNPLQITSVNGQPIAVGTPVDVPGKGTVSLNADGTLSFKPAPGYNGTFDMPYEVTDGTSTVASVITVVIDPLAPVLSLSSPGADEGSDLAFVLSLSKAATEPVTIKLALADGTDLPGTSQNESGTVGVDTGTQLQYESAPGVWTNVPSSGELTFAPGQTQINLKLATTDDQLIEPTEYVRLTADVLAGTLQNTQAVVEAAIRDDDTAPTVVATAVSVSEEGLPNGLSDSEGASDLSNSAVVIGQIQVGDVDGDAVTLTVGAPTETLYVVGSTTPIVWTPDGNGGWIGTVGANPGASVAATMAVQPDGAYTFTLNMPLQHPAQGEDVLPINFPVSVSDGVNSNTTTLSIQVEDDAPVPTDISRDVASLDTNLLIVLDTSSSMRVPSGIGDLTRLEAAVKAIGELLDKYDDVGNVMVRLVVFNSTAQALGDAWVTVSEAKALLASVELAGQTNYDLALEKAMEAYATTNGKLSNAQDVSYFLSDGNPTLSKEFQKSGVGGQNGNLTDVHLGDGIGAAEEAAWKTFLESNFIKSYAIGMGGGVTQTYLNPIAYDGQAAVDLNGVVVSDLTQLEQVLNSTAADFAEGNLGVDGTLGSVMGADGFGRVEQVVIDGNTYLYDAANPLLTVTTVLGGALTINLDTGDYRYSAAPDVAGAQAESIEFTLSDGDGDTVTSTLVIEVDKASVLEGTSSAEALLGTEHADVIYAGAGNDTVEAGAGNDVVYGAGGDDLIVGGADSDLLVGGDGTDVFAWRLGDQVVGGSGNPAPVDVIRDFDVREPSAGGDVLDLRDLLQGENTTGGTGNLDKYLRFESAGDDTVIHVSHTGDFAAGGAGTETQRIVLEGVDLRADLGLTAGAGDVEVIAKLLDQNKLIVDAT